MHRCRLSLFLAEPLLQGDDKPGIRKSPTHQTKPMRRATILTGSMAVLCVCCASCSTTKTMTKGMRYSLPTVVLLAIEKQTLYMVVETASGVIKEPRQLDPVLTPERYSVYLCKYQLSCVPTPPEITHAFDLTVSERAELLRARPKRDSERAAIAAYYRDKLKLPGPANLFDFLDGKIVWLGFGLPAADAKLLRKSGFNVDSAVFFVDTDAGRWYLGYRPWEHGVEVCCPKQHFFRRANIELGPAHHEAYAIWDYANSRVVNFGMDASEPIRILNRPQLAMVWDYRANTETDYLLEPVESWQVVLSRP